LSQNHTELSEVAQLAQKTTQSDHLERLSHMPTALPLGKCSLVTFSISLLETVIIFLFKNLLKLETSFLLPNKLEQLQLEQIL